MKTFSRLSRLMIAAALLVGAGSLAFATHAVSSGGDRDEVRNELATLTFPVYGHQKVVYQVNDSGGLFDRNYKSLLGSLRNHVAAVGADRIDLRVVLQGPGLNLLREPSQTMRNQIDALRSQGVRFLVCRNSMVDSATKPDALYGVKAGDIVKAAVAEIADLQAKGFVYLRL